MDPAPELDTSALSAYHARSAHTFASFAPSQSVSFDTQPDPIRRFHPVESPDISLLPFPNQAPANLSLNFVTISWMFYYSLALSGRRGGTYGYDLRVNPASGNLHAEECYIVLPKSIFTQFEDNEWNVWHYRPDLHALELRATFAGSASKDGALLLFTHIPLRQSWKYGMRGLRYSLLDLGHAVSAVAHAVNGLGWAASKMELDGRFARLLGLTSGIEDEREELGAAIWIGKADSESSAAEKVDALWSVLENASMQFRGTPNKLAKSALRVYPELDAALDILRPGLAATPPKLQLINTPKIDWKVIRARRSAQDFHSPSPPFSITDQQLVDFLTSLPDLASSFGGIDAAAVLLNHDLGTLPRGLYFSNLTSRTPKLAGTWDLIPKSACGRLLLLSPGWPERIAGACCCMQSLASKALFSMHFLAPLDSLSRAYVGTHLAAAHLAHAAYLWAHSNGMGCSGMGCFIDLGIPGVLGLAPESLISEKLRGFLRRDDGSERERIASEKAEDWGTMYTAGIGDPAFDERLSLDADRVYDRERERRGGLKR